MAAHGRCVLCDCVESLKKKKGFMPFLKNGGQRGDWWPRHGQCAPHLHKGKFTRLAMTDKEATQWLLTGVACDVIVRRV